MQKPLSQNRYAYVMNNPVNYWDPTGRIPQQILDGGGTLGGPYFGVPSWVVNRQTHMERTDISNGFIEERWRYDGFHREITSDAFILNTIKNEREIIRYYGVEVRDTWYYRYDQDRLTFNNYGELPLLERLIVNELVQFQGSNTVYWTETISAEHLIYANYEELARYGEPTSQEVIIFQREYIKKYLSGLYQAGKFKRDQWINQKTRYYNWDPFLNLDHQKLTDYEMNLILTYLHENNFVSSSSPSYYYAIEPITFEQKLQVMGGYNPKGTIDGFSHIFSAGFNFLYGYEIEKLTDEELTWEDAAIIANSNVFVKGAKLIFKGVYKFFKGSKKGKVNVPNIKYPGNDPTKSPGPDWEWRGKGDSSSGKGSWYNPKTNESLHPDLNHPQPIGPHWDYKSPDGNSFRIYPDGRIELK